MQLKIPGLSSDTVEKGIQRLRKIARLEPIFHIRCAHLPWEGIEDIRPSGTHFLLQLGDLNF